MMYFPVMVHYGVNCIKTTTHIHTHTHFTSNLREMDTLSGETTLSKLFYLPYKKESALKGNSLLSEGDGLQKRK